MEEPRLDVIHSVESKIHSPVRFINSTGRKVNIVWLNFSGDQVSYGILDENKQLLNMNTFVTHPWIAIDEENKQRMWLNSVDVFYPPTPQYVRVRHGNQIGRRIHRMSVPITVPVYNAQRLQDFCCQVISKTVNYEYINELPIPMFLKSQIKKHLEKHAD